MRRARGRCRGRRVSCPAWPSWSTASWRPGWSGWWARTSILLDLGRGGLGTDERAPRALPRTRVGVGALSAHGQVAAVAHPAVGADLHQPLDVHGDLLAQVALHFAFLVDDLGDAAGFLLREVLDPDARIDARLAQDLVRSAHPDPVDVGQRDLHALRAGQVDACDTCHLSLPLLVLLVRADDAHHALAAHHLALDTDFPDRRPHLHVRRLLFWGPAHRGSWRNH